MSGLKKQKKNDDKLKEELIKVQVEYLKKRKQSGVFDERMDDWRKQYDALSPEVRKEIDDAVYERMEPIISKWYEDFCNVEVLDAENYEPQVKFKSLRAYTINQLSEHGFCEEGMIDENLIRSEMRRLGNLLRKVGIDGGIFKNGSQYLITNKIAVLFDYLLNYFEPIYAKLIKKSNFEAISKVDLVTLRCALLDAVDSMGVSQPEMESILRHYEKVTGCPALHSYQTPSSIVEEAVQDCRDGLLTEITENEWSCFTQVFQEEYQRSIRPKIMEIAREKFKEFCEEIGKEYRNDGTEISENLKRGVLVGGEKPRKNSEKIKRLDEGLPI